MLVEGLLHAGSAGRAPSGLFLDPTSGSLEPLGDHGRWREISGADPTGKGFVVAPETLEDPGLDGPGEARHAGAIVVDRHVMAWRVQGERLVDRFKALGVVAEKEEGQGSIPEQGWPGLGELAEEDLEGVNGLSTELCLGGPGGGHGRRWGRPLRLDPPVPGHWEGLRPGPLLLLCSEHDSLDEPVPSLFQAEGAAKRVIWVAGLALDPTLRRQQLGPRGLGRSCGSHLQAAGGPGSPPRVGLLPKLGLGLDGGLERAVR
mmetsp:Transcript_32114/g.93246  ORF Transcript_32114/g.93246 Transcript_32114/m.93246 type:complete len:260 (-) Transcript_32114:2710-3489(-)